MISSRGLWLALSAIAAAAVALVVIRRSRTRAVPREVVGRRPVEREAAAMARWPAVPVLGTPTAEERELFATRPASILDRPGFVRLFQPGDPREPLDGATRRQLKRWAAVGVAFVLLAVCAQVLEHTAFSKGDEVGIATAHVAPVEVTEEPVQALPDADCRPGTAEPRVRKVDAKMTRAVNRQWDRIERWLRTNAPRSYRTLGGPGKATTIAVAEAQMGLRFPDDLRASLLRHNGSVHAPGILAFGFLGNSNMSVREIRDTWRMLCDIDDEDTPDAGDPRTDWWDGRMIPFGADGLGDHLVIDSVRRDVGETDHEGNMTFEPAGVRIRSFHALLKATADALEKGVGIGYWQPRALSGELDWEVD